MAAIAASVVAPYGLVGFTPLSVSRKSRFQGRRFTSACAKSSSCLDSQPSATRPLHPFSEVATKSDLSRNWMGRIVETDVGKVLAPIAASAGFYLQDTALALEEVVKVENPPDDLLVVVGISAFYAFLYFLVIPAIVYNYLRLRWYKRNAAETFFQFMLVFVFFPGMLLLAPFINFRRLPKEGTEPP